jgi:hypothetical protein
MKIKKLVRVIAKSDFMDIDATLTSSKATGYVKKLRKIHELQLDAMRVPRKVTYRKGFEMKTRTVRELPEGVNPSITLTIEPAGEILD